MMGRRRRRYEYECECKAGFTEIMNGTITPGRIHGVASLVHSAPRPDKGATASMTVFAAQVTTPLHQATNLGRLFG